MEIRVLGPVEIWHEGNQIPLARRQQRLLLGALSLEVNRLRPVEHLIEFLWGEHPPRQARAVVQTRISELRAILPFGRDGQLTGRQLASGAGASGYVLQLPPEWVDVHLFRQLCLAASRTESAEQARDLLRRAVELHRGPALGGWVTNSAYYGGLYQSLESARLTAMEDLFEAELQLGRQFQIVDELLEQVSAHPGRERLVAEAMVALQRTGRTAEALLTYDRCRRWLAAELGIDPGGELQRLHLGMLRREAEPTARSSTLLRLDRPTAPAADSGGNATPTEPVVRFHTATPSSLPHAISDLTGGATQALADLAEAPDVFAAGPAQLPRDIVGFAGRRDDLARLDAVAATVGPGLRICGIWGTPGVGKTTLAVHWAQRVRDRFPDGQLYVDLRGFDPSALPMSAAEAVRGFLDALGVPASRQPATADTQTALYRSLLADRRTLVVLDNARDADQVRPLLPGAPGCLVLVTSRNRLTGLVATDGLRPITLDLLDRHDARELLAARIGQDRVAAEPAAVDALVDRCARLPLALAIAAARAVSDPEQPLAALAAELTDKSASLDPLEPGDDASDLRRVFSWSCSAISAPALRLFRLLSLHPGPEIAEAAAASLAGVPMRQTRALLGELVRAHLITERSGHRYVCHDLLRAFAAEDVEDSIGPLRRLLDHYVATASSAARLVLASRQPMTLDPPADGVTVTSLVELTAAMQWFAAEYPALLALLQRAAAAGFDRHVWQLAWSLRDFFDRSSLRDEQACVQHAGLAAAQRLGDRAGQADAHRSLGRANADQGLFDDAGRHYQRAFELYGELGNHLGQARVHMSMGMLSQRQGDICRSLDHHRQALALFDLAEDNPGRANAHNNIALNLLHLGDYAAALEHGETALAYVHKLEPWSEASVWDTLSRIHLRSGCPERAVDCGQRALKLIQRVGDRFYESVALVSLADAYEAADNQAAAVEALRSALAILDELDHAEAARVRERLLAADR
jgi:DNA-binding SARP family transcriptional activator/tetratricopeptide (TPR) repeat protein